MIDLTSEITDEVGLVSITRGSGVCVCVCVCVCVWGGGVAQRRMVVSLQKDLLCEI